MSTMQKEGGGRRREEAPCFKKTKNKKLSLNPEDSYTLLEKNKKGQKDLENILLKNID